MTGAHVSGVELSGGFYREVLEPALAPWPHAAAHLGFGSDVLGFDDERSTDHGWGPRAYVFVAEDDIAAARAAIDAALPETYRGWPVVFGWDDTPARDHVHVGAVRAWVREWIGCDPLEGMTNTDWLCTPQQRLLGVVRGEVFRDDLAELTDIRHALVSFPLPVRLWMLACQWRRLAQEEHFVGRTSEVGDELGSRVLAARLVREIMRVHFLLAGEYWPYTKWLGTAYRSLPGSAELLPLLSAIVDARTHAEREDALVAAYESLARMHNASGCTAPVDPTVRPFHTRPFRTLDAGRFVDASLAAVGDESLRALPLIGSIDQWCDSVDVLAYPEVYRRFAAVYETA